MVVKLEEINYVSASLMRFFMKIGWCFYPSSNNSKIELCILIWLLKTNYLTDEK
jgi:hypothetical protein